MKTVILLKDRVYQRSTTIDKLVILAEHFQVSTDYLVGITDDPTWRGGPGGMA